MGIVLLPSHDVPSCCCFLLLINIQRLLLLLSAPLKRTLIGNGFCGRLAGEEKEKRKRNQKEREKERERDLLLLFLPKGERAQLAHCGLLLLLARFVPP
jgi:hypothetical protein